MLVYLQSFVAVAIGILSTVTDFKEKKIYNKTIIGGVSISLLLYIVLWNQIDMELIKSYVINLGISVLISFLFFYFKSWAAGDAKLFIAMIIMIPFELYEVDTTNVFPGIYLLIIIFSVAFIYVVIETIFLWSKDSEKFKKIKITRFDTASVKEWLEKYFMGYFITLFVNNVVFTVFPAFQEQNGALILICNMLLLIFVYRVIQSKKQTIIAIAISAALNVIYYAIMGFTFYPINIKMLVIVVAIMLFRNVSEKYNYECIKITDLKPRMILSYGSVLKFYSSRIKGLPKQTTESTDSRLTEDEVNSIKRWSKSAKGEDSIVIVRHMPFAPFMLIGEIIFFALHLYI